MWLDKTCNQFGCTEQHNNGRTLGRIYDLSFFVVCFALKKTKHWKNSERCNLWFLIYGTTWPMYAVKLIHGMVPCFIYCPEPSPPPPPPPPPPLTPNKSSAMNINFMTWSSHVNMDFVLLPSVAWERVRVEEGEGLGGGGWVVGGGGLGVGVGGEGRGWGWGWDREMQHYILNSLHN